MKLFLLSILTTASMLAVDATGRWAGTLTPEGRDGHPALLLLKQEGTKLSGTVGPDEGERHDISNGKAEGGVLTFESATESGIVMKFSLKQEGDQLSGTITRERDGQKTLAALALTREK
jgi:hypothetical protein